MLALLTEMTFISRGIIQAPRLIHGNHTYFSPKDQIIFGVIHTDPINLQAIPGLLYGFFPNLWHTTFEENDKGC